MLSAFINTFKITELRQRILFTFGLIFVCRVIAAIPLPVWMRLRSGVLLRLRRCSRRLIRDLELI